MASSNPVPGPVRPPARDGRLSVKRVTEGLLRRWKTALGLSGRRPHRPRGERLVFVGGAPRSGTTLVQHVLDCHPAVFGGPEFDCVPALMAARRRVLGALDAGRITVFCSRRQIDGAFADLVEALLLPVANARGARLLSEKTPQNVEVFTDLLEVLPGCRAVHVVRDPRAVVASLLNVGARARSARVPMMPAAQNVATAVPYVRALLDAGFRAAHWFPGRVLTLLYESLVSDAEPVVRRLCQFLGLDFCPAMLQPQAKKHPAQDEIVRLGKGIFVDPALGFRAIETSRVGVWRKDLDAAQVAAINAGFRDHPVLRGLGYTFE